MNFQLLKLIIWPKSEEFEPRIVDFKPGKVNVITGASRTGKSAIIPIIDYCLASSDCFIPIDTIREHASWYGVVFQTESEQILIAREVPHGKEVSNNFYLSREQIISIPSVIEEANEKRDGVKLILNTLSSVPSFRLDGDDENIPYKARLGFRDLMALVFQNQDIVANQNILFYKTHAHEHRERLRNWFPFILGAEDIEILSKRQRLKEIEKRLMRKKREFDKTKDVSSSWMSNILGHIKIAKEYGFLEKEISDSNKPDDLLADAKYIIEHISNHSKTKFEDIDAATKEMVEIEVEEERLSIEIGVAKKRLSNIKRLKSGLIAYGDSIKKRRDRLHISQWLDDISLETQKCPACGNADHPNSADELKKISSAFKKYEDESKSIAEIPSSFRREEELIKLDIENLLEEKKNYQKRFDLLIRNNKKAQEEFQCKKSMFISLGHLMASAELLGSIVDGGDLEKEITALEIEHSELIRSVDRGGVQRRVDAATIKISQKILNHLKTLDVEDKYRKNSPQFNIKNLNISVLSNDGHWHPLSEVGSASNWVSFHIALMCSLQEYYLEHNISYVPSFVIFDQPSQVYFPKLKRGEKDVDFNHQYEDEDVDAVKNMFRTIANSIIDKEGGWQSIILDHADDEIYKEIEGVYEVEEWRNGKMLIPEEWYNNRVDG